jgi:hypothetical protein
MIRSHLGLRSISRGSGLKINGSHPDYAASHVWAIRPGPSVTNPLQPSGPDEELNTSLIIVLIIWDLLLFLGLALTLIAVVGWFLAADESICLDRQPVWASREPRGLHGLFRAHTRVASEVGLGLLVPPSVASTGRATVLLTFL